MVAEYPKMKTTTVNGVTVPLRYPDNHAAGGKIIIFNSKADEEAFNASGVTGIAIADPEHPKGKGR